MSEAVSQAITKKKEELANGASVQQPQEPSPQMAVQGQMNPLNTMSAEQVQQPMQGGIQPVNTEGNTGFNADANKAQIEESLKAGSDAYYENQKAQFDKQLSGQLTNLEKAYNDAVANGELSVKDAQQQFEDKKNELYETAYQQSESTKIAGNEMGIQNSQQMMGMKAGDNARFNKLHNTNMTEKDRRVNDIRDRIKLIGQQKDLDMAQAQNDHAYNLAGAKGQADQMYNDKLHDFQQKDHFTQQGQQHESNMMDKEQGFKQDNMDKQQGFDLDKMDKNQKFTIDNMNLEQKFTQENMDKQHDNNTKLAMTEYNNRLGEIAKQSELRIKEMGVGHDFDIKKMEKQLANDLALEAKRYSSYGGGGGGSSSSYTNYAKQATSKIQANNNKIYSNLKKAQDAFTPGTPEYKALELQADFEAEAYAKKVYQEALASESANKVIKLANSTPQKVPKPLNVKVLGKTVYDNSKKIAETKNKNNAIKKAKAEINNSKSEPKPQLSVTQKAGYSQVRR